MTLDPILSRYHQIQTRPITLDDRISSIPQKIFTESPLVDRTKQIFQAVQGVYEAIYDDPELQPKDPYILRTDRYHYQEVWGRVKELKPDHSIALAVAAMLHDIERYLEKHQEPPLSGDADTHIRKKVFHPLNSARIAMELLKSAPLSDQEKEDIQYLIERHDANLEEIKYNESILLEGVSPDHRLYPDLVTLIKADAMAFFNSSVFDFIADYKWTSPDKELVRRVRLCYDKLNDPSQQVAVSRQLFQKKGSFHDIPEKHNRIKIILTDAGILMSLDVL